MPFHWHSLDVVRLVFRHVYADCGHGLCHVEHFVNTHADVVEPEQPLQLLVHFQCHEADTDMSLYPAAREVEHGTYLQLRLCYPESLMGSFP